MLRNFGQGKLKQQVIAEITYRAKKNYVKTNPINENSMTSRLKGQYSDQITYCRHQSWDSKNPRQY